MYQKVILIGNLGTDPELKELQSSKVCTFSLATSESYKDKSTGEKKTVTEWHRIVLWNRTAEIAAQYCKKGSQVMIEGKINYRSYDNKEGVKQYITEIKGDNLILMGSKPDAKQQPSQFSPKVQESLDEEGSPDSSLPF